MEEGRSGSGSGFAAGVGVGLATRMGLALVDTGLEIQHAKNTPAPCARALSNKNPFADPRKGNTAKNTTRFHVYEPAVRHAPWQRVDRVDRAGRGRGLTGWAGGLHDRTAGDLVGRG